MTEPTIAPSGRRVRTSWSRSEVVFYCVTGTIIVCGSTAYGILLAVPV